MGSLAFEMDAKWQNMHNRFTVIGFPISSNPSSFFCSHDDFPLCQSSWFQFGITQLSAGPAASVTYIGTTQSGYHLRRASPLSIQWFSSLTGHTSLHFDDSQVFARITFTLLSPRLGIFFLSHRTGVRSVRVGGFSIFSFEFALTVIHSVFTPQY